MIRGQSNVKLFAVMNMDVVSLYYVIAAHFIPRLVISS